MKVAIIGLGSVGSGVYNQLIENKDKFKLDSDIEIELSYGIARTINEKKRATYSLLELSDNYHIALDDDSVDCIIEVMGGVKQGYEVIKKALLNKKHVVSANKDLFALHGKELIDLARKQGCDLYFEASVAGGLPLLRSIYKGLASDHLYEFYGILNGTSNFILTKMAKERLDYAQALKQAQDLGFAESDPTADVRGLDAARKVAILGMLCFNVDTKFDDVKVEGITNISSDAIKLASTLGYTIKLIGKATYKNNNVSLSVNPCFVYNNHFFAQVNNEMNAVFLKGEAIGDIMIYGAGAGANPTATAIMSDVLEVAKNMKYKANSCDLINIYNEKNIGYNLAIKKYIYIGSSISLKDISGKYNTKSLNDNYIIVEVNEKDAYQIKSEYDVEMYMVLDE